MPRLDTTGAAYGRIVHAIPEVVTGAAGLTGNSMSVQTTFVPTNAALIIQSNKVGVVPLQIRLKNTTAGASTTSSYCVFAVDTGARWSSGGAQLHSQSSDEWYGTDTARPQHITNGDFASAASWAVTGGFTIGSGVATYSHVAGTGILSQIKQDMTSGSLIKPDTDYDIRFTTSSPSGTGIVGVGLASGAGYIASSASVLPVVSGAVVAGTFVRRIRTNSTLASTDALGISVISNAAAAFSIDDISMQYSQSDSVAYFGAITAAAEVDAKYFYPTELKVAAAPCWALRDEVIFDFSPNNSVSAEPTFAPATLSRWHYNFEPVYVPAGGSFLMHIWNVANATTAPAFAVDVTWTEV